jgi:hypothetical protein
MSASDNDKSIFLSTFHQKDCRFQQFLDVFIRQFRSFRVTIVRVSCVDDSVLLSASCSCKEQSERDASENSCAACNDTSQVSIDNVFGFAFTADCEKEPLQAHTDTPFGRDADHLQPCKVGVAAEAYIANGHHQQLF